MQDRSWLDLRKQMRDRSESYRTADADGNDTLSFEEFCHLPSNAGKDVALCRALFDEVDIDGSGTIDRREYLQLALMEALASTGNELDDLCREADKNRDGKISRMEFRWLVRSLRFQASTSDVDAVFDTFDADGSGYLEYAELKAAVQHGGAGGAGDAEEGGRARRAVLRERIREATYTKRLAEGLSPKAAATPGATSAIPPAREGGGHDRAGGVASGAASRHPLLDGHREMDDLEAGGYGKGPTRNIADAVTAISGRHKASVCDCICDPFRCVVQ